MASTTNRPGEHGNEGKNEFPRQICGDLSHMGMCKRPNVTEYTLVFISTGCYGRLRRASGARTARALALRATFSANSRRFSGQLMPDARARALVRRRLMPHRGAWSGGMITMHGQQRHERTCWLPGCVWCRLVPLTKLVFQFSPGICCMCLLRGLNGHFRPPPPYLPPIGGQLASEAAT